MKTLSIKQPWASLIAHGIKDVENRTWRTNFRGRIYIHASGAKDKGFLSLLNKKQVNDLRSKTDLSFDFPTSSIIGSVEIVDCVQNYPSIWSEVDLTGTKPIWNWVLRNPVLFDEPILNIKGKLSLWDF